MVSQPTISIQLKELEASLGQRLFDRAGRGLKLTETGRIAYNYANGIFSLGQEMVDALEHQPTGRALKLSVGVLDVIPKMVVRQLLQPALGLEEPVRLICREDKADRLLADLVARRTDVVLSDAPIGTAVAVEGFNHLLGESEVSFFAMPELAGRIKRGFPHSLDGQPLLLPTDHTELRRSLNQWLDSKRIHPVVVGEFDDTALMFGFARSGAGIFPAPSMIETTMKRELGVRLVGRAEGVCERYYAISLEAKLKHPAVKAICDAARRTLGGRSSS